VLPGAAESFPKNTIDYALENNLFAEKAYPQQSEQAFATYHAYVDRGRRSRISAMSGGTLSSNTGHAGDGQLGIREVARIPRSLMVQVLTSTTSHKRELLLPSLEVFARLGLRDIDLNLHHILELNTPVREVVRTASGAGITFHAASGGWCDFFHEAPQVDDTFRSVAHQVNICGQLGVSVCVSSSAFASRRVYARRLRDCERKPHAPREDTPGDAVCLRESRRRLAQPECVRRNPRAVESAEHQDELRPESTSSATVSARAAHWMRSCPSFPTCT
jgi:hypothetical protein